MPDPCANIRAGLVAELQQHRLSRARLRALLNMDLPAEPRTFSVWTGSVIGGYSLPELCDAIKALAPPGEWAYEWWVLAGEGGSWAARWDTYSPLAIGSAADLGLRREFAAGLGVRVVPWVVMRGRPGWGMEERLLIRQCVEVAGVCALNLESGPSYWNGPVSPLAVAEWLEMLDVPRERLWLTVVPRLREVDTLGGIDTLSVWLRYVAGCSLECYGLTAPDLRVDVAVPRWRALFSEFGSWYSVPIVERGEIADWTDSEYVSLAMQVWALD